MLIPGIGPRKKGARRHTMFFFRLFATPIFFAHQRTVGLLRDPDKSNSHEQIQDEYRWVPWHFQRENAHMSI